MKSEVKYIFDNNEELHDWLEKSRACKSAARILSLLKSEMRTQVKHGEHQFPDNKTANEAADERDSFWYSRLFELAQEEGVDLWEL